MISIEKKRTMVEAGVLALVLFTFLSCLLAALQKYPAYSMAGDQEYVQLESGWSIYQGDRLLFEDAALPRKFIDTGESYTLVNRLPASSPYQRPDLQVKTYYMDVSCRVDGQPVYTYGPEERGFYKSGGMICHTFSLPDDWTGKELRLTIRPLAGNMNNDIAAPVISTRSQMFMRGLRDSVDDILINNSLLFLGFLLLVAFLVLRQDHRWNREFLLLALFLILSSLYYFSRMEITPYFIENSYAVYMVEYSVFAMLPGMVLIICGPACDKKFQPILGVLELFIAVNTVFLVVAGTFSKYEFAQLGFFSFILKLLSFFAVLAFLLLTKPAQNGKRNSMLISFLPYCAGTMVASFLHYTDMIIDVVMLEKIGILLFASLQLYFLVQAHFEVYREAMDKQIFEKLAFTDLLTGLKNRNAFELALQDLESYAACYLLSIDINNLKTVNDTLGHAKGDELIVEVSRLIREFFPDAQCFRIGGDEFQIIVTGKTEEAVQDGIAAMKENAKRAGCGLPVSIACGYARYDKFSGAGIQAAQILADQNMYADKVREKAMRERPLPSESCGI